MVSQQHDDQGPVPRRNGRISFAEWELWSGNYQYLGISEADFRRVVDAERHARPYIWAARRLLRGADPAGPGILDDLRTVADELRQAELLISDIARTLGDSDPLGTWSPALTRLAAELDDLRAEWPLLDAVTRGRRLRKVAKHTETLMKCIDRVPRQMASPG